MVAQVMLANERGTQHLNIGLFTSRPVSVLAGSKRLVGVASGGRAWAAEALRFGSPATGGRGALCGAWFVGRGEVAARHDGERGGSLLLGGLEIFNNFGGKIIKKQGTFEL